jgi:4-hydroxy-tetrahydrodipicolinate synthase
MLNSEWLRGIFVPVVTPFLSNGELDMISYQTYVRMLLKQRIQGVVIGGTTGEAPTLSWEELESLFLATRAAMQEEQIPLPIIMGTGTNDTASTMLRTRQAQAMGADAVLVVTPYYNRPAPSGILEHYQHVSQAGIPVIAYNIPYRTGATLSTDTLLSILELPNIIGLKDSSGGIQQLIELTRLTNKPVLCGEDFYFYAALCCGAQGGILASSSLYTERFVQVYERIQEGRFHEARTEFDPLIPLIQLLYREPNPAPVKWLLKHKGLIQNDTLRLPMTSISEQLQAELLLLP